MDTTVRIAGPDDAAALSEVAKAAFTETFGHLYPPTDLAAFLHASYSTPVIRAELADTSNRWWIAETDGRAVGYAQAGACTLPHDEVGPADGELKRIYLLADAQGTGVGRTLLDLALDWTEERYRGPVWIGVWSENERAQAIYARRGFTKVGEYQFAVGETRDAEWILRRDRPSS
jgi:ribosomal protein S18 acetylase RimI-like enzyme